MAAILIHPDAVQAFVKLARNYGNEHHRSAEEMGVALVMAGTMVLSTGMNNVQLEEVYRHIAKSTAELRKPNAS